MPVVEGEINDLLANCNQIGTQHIRTGYKARECLALQPLISKGGKTFFGREGGRR
jgi:hypothetical protein